MAGIVDKIPIAFGKSGTNGLKSLNQVNFYFLTYCF